MRHDPSFWRIHTSLADGAGEVSEGELARVVLHLKLIFSGQVYQCSTSSDRDSSSAQQDICMNAGNVIHMVHCYQLLPSMNDGSSYANGDQ